MNHTILFVCPHNAAKSVLAVAYFQQLARQHRLVIHVTSAGTEPDARISPAVATLFHTEGVDMTFQSPRLLTQADIDAASRIITLSCPLDQFDLTHTRVERWDDVPLPVKGCTHRVQPFTGPYPPAFRGTSGARMSHDTAFLDALLRDYEHSGGGVRELNERLKRATTCAEFEHIAVEAQCRSTLHHVPPSIETAYQVLSVLARRRLEEGKDVHHG